MKLRRSRRGGLSAEATAFNIRAAVFSKQIAALATVSEANQPPLRIVTIVRVYSDETGLIARCPGQFNGARKCGKIRRPSSGDIGHEFTCGSCGVLYRYEMAPEGHVLLVFKDDNPREVVLTASMRWVDDHYEVDCPYRDCRRPGMRVMDYQETAREKHCISCCRVFNLA